MGTRVDVHSLSFSNSQIAELATKIVSDFLQWSSKRNANQAMGESKPLDEDTIYLGKKIDNLAEIMSTKLDEWEINGEKVCTPTIKTNSMHISSQLNFVFPRTPSPIEYCTSCINNTPNNDKIGMVKVRNLTSDEVDKAKDDKENVLGCGGFGTVYKGNLGGQRVAIKEFHGSKQKDGKKGDKLLTAEYDTYIKQVFQELLPLLCYPAENVIQLLAYSFDETHQNKPCLILSYMENGSLYDRLCMVKDTPPLTWEQRANIALGIARGLTHLHSIPILHGDIKSSNILLDKHFEAKIGDFGTVALLDRGVGKLKDDKVSNQG